MKKIIRIWENSPSGLLVPTGTTTQMLNGGKTTYLNIKTKGEEIETLYTNSQVDLPCTCDLSRLIENAKSLWEKWFVGKTAELKMVMLYRALHLDRIATPTLLLKDIADIERKKKYLEALTSGTLDFFKREKSAAKDFLWEIEVWAKLRRKLRSVELEEPPDIVVHFDDSQIGIACKKLYSEKHVQNILSQAVSQIEDSFDFGIVAINIDDLTPPGKLVNVSNHREMSQFIQNLNCEFIQRHERHLRKYLSSGRLISAIVCTNVVAYTEKEEPRFNNASEWTVWTIPGLSAEKERHVGRFRDIVM